MTSYMSKLWKTEKMTISLKNIIIRKSQRTICFKITVLTPHLDIVYFKQWVYVTPVSSAQVKLF